MFASSEASCALEEGWVSGHKDTRCSVRPAGSVSDLTCPHGTVITKVRFASYGKPTGNCGAFVPNPSCHSAVSEEIVHDLCVGETTCSISVTADTFGEDLACAAVNVADDVRLAVEVECGAGPNFNEDVYFNAWSSKNWAAAESEIETRKLTWMQALAAVPAYPEASFSDKGIVVVAGGRYLKPAVVMINLLRKSGYTDRIQVWHLGKEEMTDAHREVLRPFNVETRDFRDYVEDALLRPIQANVGMRRFQLKPLAILHSDLEDVLLLDSDNCPLRDPSYLFDSTEFAENGAVFWPDFWKTSVSNPIWRVIGQEVEKKDGVASWEQESGQLLINKRKSWKALNLAVHFNTEYYMKLLNGDKDTFRFAWKASHTPYFMVKDWPTSVGTLKELHSAQHGFCGHTMLQHDLQGQPLFVHHNQLKSAHLPLGENFKYQKSPAADATTFRAVPVVGMKLNSYGTLACTDIGDTGLKNVDEDRGVVSRSGLEAFEVDYMTALEEASDAMDAERGPKALLPVAASDAAAAARARRTTNVTANCPLDQFEVRSSPAVCENIAPECASGSEVAAPTATSDRKCAYAKTFPVTLVPSLDSVNRIAISIDGAAARSSVLRLNSYATYQFSSIPSDLDFTLLGAAAAGGKATASGDTLTLETGDVGLAYGSTNNAYTGNDIQVSEATYVKTWIGDRPKNSGAKVRFSTAFDADYQLYELRKPDDDSISFKNLRTECKALCNETPECVGIHIYALSSGSDVSTICNGLSSLGRAGGASTQLDSQSWTRVLTASLK